MNDQESIQGTWSVVSGERHGKAFSEEVVKHAQLVFSKDTMSTKSKAGATHFKFKLNAPKTPKEIDIDMDGTAGLGIYALDGDDLKILHGEGGDARPTSFEIKDGSRVTLLVLRREKR